MSGPDSPRRDLGRRLAGVRRAAGFTQRQLAAVAGYSRSTVSNAEIGHPDVARGFWVRCDEVLKTSKPFASAFDQVRAAEGRHGHGAAEAMPGAGAGEPRRVLRAICSFTVAGALARYRELGWPVRPCEGGVELVTGTVVDALELPRPAGVLAMSLWLYSRGRADAVRRLPALPDPAQALAVMTAGDRCFFLAVAGDSPWAGSEPGPVVHQGAGMGVIRWHAGGGAIPVPPSRLPGGQVAAWAHLPVRQMRLAPPVALLGLLATAVSMASGGEAGLTLPGGIRVVSAARQPAPQ